MKKFYQCIKRNFVVVIVALVTTAASLFAAMPCLGPIYEPELPEELRK